MKDATSLLTDVRQDILRLEGEIAKLKTVESWLAHQVPAIRVVTHINRASPGHAVLDDADDDKPTGQKVIAAAIDILRRHGGELTTSDLAVELTRLGMMGGRSADQFRNYIYTTLARSENVEKVGAGLWKWVK
ncbi:hypothetical protein BH11PLA2_BH11PLA2_46320 [soil metagenome]